MLLVNNRECHIYTIGRYSLIRHIQLISTYMYMYSLIDSHRFAVLELKRKMSVVFCAGSMESLPTCMLLVLVQCVSFIAISAYIFFVVLQRQVPASDSAYLKKQVVLCSHGL